MLVLSNPFLKGTPGVTTDRDEDARLLALYAQGDRRAATELLARLAPMVLSLARRMLRDDAEAEDVVQEAMLRLWHIAPDWDPERARVSTWLYRVVMNLCTDRQRRRRPSVAIDDVAEQIGEAEKGPAALQARARKEALQEALDTLPERQKTAVILRDLQDLSNPEIAGIMELSVEAVESLLSRGRRGLRKALADQKEALGFEDD